MTYSLYQCPKESCRFRFPAAEDVEPADGFVCPHCGNLTARVVNTYVVASDRKSPSDATKADAFDAPHLELMLDNIRSVGNVGSLFRTADGAGIRALHLGGITATPDHERFSKSALGLPLPWEHRLNGVDLAVELKQRGRALWALEETPDADNIFDVGHLESARPTVLVVGNEVMGVDPAIMSMCDRVVSIPMVGAKRSLNVVVACGIAAYVLLHGRPQEEHPELV